ncbi:hypothetical protein AWM75_03450 [Aerococcus urinaehominis]|uniref:methylated-DNA--[protein]-cysteine S-methyltransferase n=1 Tax=Aerococcus urinaehominis TaxID=128944 RepID=A0A120IAT6_9LACT|nr:methylated-DNA--[protein]-cysteine S-methyltransferase [Aerococcus urinaehominis]AMB99114.1 hypothetical protein AWM75_03450 [Aerococcus urinaehominis]SDM04137.1 methylated-DNA-[protein]-cysteine S-methyltransferase [Aerococcus urinaehominis]
MYKTKITSPLGDLWAFSSGYQLQGLYLNDQKNYPFARYNQSIQEDSLPIFKQTRAGLDRYWLGDTSALDQIAYHLPVATPFQKLVWQEIASIPHGQWRSYGQLAKQIASKRGLASMSSQAVGQAVAKNPLLVIIPCHRILGKDGQLTGYAGGLAAKRYLLKLEGINWHN